MPNLRRMSLLLTLMSVAASGQIRINAGGPSVTDLAGSWNADSLSTGGASFAYNPPSVPSPIYNTVRYGPLFQYNVPTIPGKVKVRLHFIELSTAITTAGLRSFDVLLDGTPTLTDFDIYGEVGFGKSLVKEFTVTTTGLLKIAFVTKVRSAMVSAIEVLPVASFLTSWFGKLEAYKVLTPGEDFTPKHLVMPNTCLKAWKNGVFQTEGPDYTYTGDTLVFCVICKPVLGDYVSLEYVTVEAKPRLPGEVNGAGSCGAQMEK